MKVRLRITPPAGQPYIFEHGGPLVHIGREPVCELSFAGSSVVSGRHGLLELTEEGLFLIDTGSTNGIYLGDSTNRLSRARLDQGESFRLGLGPESIEVYVAAFDPTPSEPPPVMLEPVHLAPARPAPRPEPKPIPIDEAPQIIVKQSGVPMGTVLGVGATLLLAAGVVVFLAWPKKGTPTEPAKEIVEKPKQKEKPVEPIEVPKDRSKVETPKRKDPVIVEEPKKNDPLGDVKSAGIHFAPKDGPPVLLLQRRRDPEPWGRLRDGDRIDTDYHLVSLPGYRSRIHIGSGPNADSGLRMTLWGNVPQFSPFPPVLESAVMLTPSSPGIDLEFTLERGRVHLAKSKDGDKRVRVRFLNETWDVTLAERNTEVVLELWGIDVPGGAPAGAGGPVLCVGLFTKGGGSIKVNGREQKFSQPSQLLWSNQNKVMPSLAAMKTPPDWWTDQLDPRANRDVGLAMLALSDFHELLSKTDDIVDTVLTRVKESPDASVRTLGVSFLAAMDALPHVLTALEHRHSEVRGSAASALRRWIGRGADQRLELLRMLQTRGGYSKDKADLILKLLQGVPRADAEKPEVFAQLLGYLTHENLAVRELASQNLATLAPELAKVINYDPDADGAARTRAADEWKKRTGGKAPAASKQ